MNKTTTYKIEISTENMAQELANKIPLQTLIEAAKISRDTLIGKYEVHIVSDLQKVIERTLLLDGKIPVVGSGNSKEIIGWLEQDGRNSLP